MGAGPAAGSLPGCAPAEALAATIGALDAAGVTGRFNLLLTDGQLIAATAAGDTLWYRPAGPSVPGWSLLPSRDDEPGWTEVPDRPVITASHRRPAPPTSLDAAAPQSLTSQTLTEDGRIAIP